MAQYVLSRIPILEVGYDFSAKLSVKFYVFNFLSKLISAKVLGYSPHQADTTKVPRSGSFFNIFRVLRNFYDFREINPCHEFMAGIFLRRNIPEFIL